MNNNEFTCIVQPIFNNILIIEIILYYPFFQLINNDEDKIITEFKDMKSNSAGQGLAYFDVL